MSFTINQLANNGLGDVGRNSLAVINLDFYRVFIIIMTKC